MSILDGVSKGEGKKIEFKQQFPSGSSIAKTAVAFSNGAGGKLLIGVMNDGTINGISDNEVLEFPDRISNIIYDTCYPAIIPEIYSENIENKNILVIQIYPGNLKPYYIKSEGKINGTYIRVGATNKLADQEMIIELERQRMNVSFDEEYVFDVDIDNIDLKSLSADFLGYTGKNLNESEMINLKILKNENGRMLPSKAAMLLTGSRYFEFARIKCARFKGNDVGEFIDQKEIAGSIYAQVENALNFAKMYIAKKGVITELQRIDEYEVPMVAIREAITNAVVHRDYSISGSDIKLAIFDDRIEITSPGQLPKTLDIEEIKQGRSEIRNKVIARFFKELRFIEEWGTGIKRIIKTCEEAGLKEPDFIETGMHFKVIIYKQSSDKVAISSDNVAIKNNENVLTESERLIVRYLETNESINNRIAREITSLSPAGARKLFESLSNKKIIKAFGENKSRYYVLNSKNKF